MSVGQYWNGSRDNCKRRDLKTNRHINIQSSSVCNLGLKQNGTRACCGGRIQSSSLRGSPKVAEEWNRKTTFCPQIHRKNFECWANSTKQLLNAGRGHQVPRKAAHCLRKEVGQNIQEKKRDKWGRDRDLSWDGSLKRGEVSKHRETLSLAGQCGVLESQRVT